MKKYRLGLDIHGVIDVNPELMSVLSSIIIDDGGEVHIITGIRWGKNIVKQLNNYFVKWTHHFSITTYHEKIGTPVTYKNNNRNHPLIDENIWNSTKAKYCKEHDIDIMIDDSDIYGEYFKDIKTRYIKYKSKKNEEKLK